MTSKQVNDYIKSHGILDRNGQVVLTKPLFVFKKVITGNAGGVAAIANLVIPIGATVNLCYTGREYRVHTKKLRASMAYCHSIATLAWVSQWDHCYATKSIVGIKQATSRYDSKFKYNAAVYVGSPVTTEDFTNLDMWHRLLTNKAKCSTILKSVAHPNYFDVSKDECSGGIHFFLELKSALEY